MGQHAYRDVAKAVVQGTRRSSYENLQYGNNVYSS